MVVIVFGLPGTGKSYFASRFAKMINAEYINSDLVRKEIFEERTYSDREKETVYHQMMERMRNALNQNRKVVLDATFYKNDTRRPFIDEMQGKGRIFFIEVQADENIIRKRLRRSRQDSEADFGVYKLIRKQWEPLDEPHLVLESTDDNMAIMLQKAVEYMDKKDDKGTDQ